jgi:hypothetical protein
MAKVLVLTDRTPDDTDWKGALTWRTILALAECQHEVLVATPAPFERIGVTHPRLNIIRPIQSWAVSQLPKLAKTLLTYRPDVVHTFALNRSKLWPSLSLWPFFSALPGFKKIVTLFEPSDCDSKQLAFEWYRSANRLTVFSEEMRHSLGKSLARALEVLPLDFDLEPSLAESQRRLLIPASVAEWREPLLNLEHMADYLRHNPEIEMRIIGGWGDYPQSERKQAWNMLGECAARLSLSEGVSLPEFVKQLRGAQGIWLEPLPRDSWRFLLSSQLARQLGKGLIVSTPPSLALAAGSTANSLSRIYTGL